MSEDDLVALMIGRPARARLSPERPRPTSCDEVSLERLRAARRPLRARRPHAPHRARSSASPARRETARCSSSARSRASSGSRARRAATARRSTSGLRPGALRAGIVLLSGERVRESLFPVLGVRDNSTIQVLRRFSRAGWVRRRKERDAVTSLVRTAQGAHARRSSSPCSFLSGGNQQKVALTRPFLRGDVSVILADEPTQGVDVRSRFDIYEALRAKAGEGVAVIVKSSDPLELSGLCDRVIVISRGRIIDEIPAAELSERRIIEAIVGSQEPRAAGAERTDRRRRDDERGSRRRAGAASCTRRCSAAGCPSR